MRSGNATADSHLHLTAIAPGPERRSAGALDYEWNLRKSPLVGTICHVCSRHTSYSLARRQSRCRAGLEHFHFYPALFSKKIMVQRGQIEVQGIEAHLFLEQPVDDLNGRGVAIQFVSSLRAVPEAETDFRGARVRLAVMYKVALIGDDCLCRQ